MQTIKDQKLAKDLIHALRSELTIYNFAVTNDEKDKVVKSMAKLIDRADLLVQVQKLDIKHNHVDFDSLVQEVYAQFGEDRLQLSLASQQVHGDKKLLSIMVEELIENAMNYTAGDVFVSTHFTNKNIVFRIEDLGDGLARNIATHMGDPFLTSADTRSGHGLGLSLAWAIVQAHGGAMTIHTEKGSGTTVLVTLDLV